LAELSSLRLKTNQMAFLAQEIFEKNLLSELPEDLLKLAEGNSPETWLSTVLDWWGI
jgi:hypothetical protein